MSAIVFLFYNSVLFFIIHDVFYHILSYNEMR
uniref:Uncharacterized protein n=1 Tax=Anopheles dirus TaxID=7168 RepID=A0A182NYW0_9DIPT